MKLKDLVQSIRVTSVGKRFSRGAKKGKTECQMCGSKKYLRTHHIEPLNEIVIRLRIQNLEDYYHDKNGIRVEMINPSNSMVLCQKCHSKVHKLHIDI